MSTFNLSISKCRGECKINLQCRDESLQIMTNKELGELLAIPYHHASETMDKVPFIQKVIFSSSVD